MPTMEVTARDIYVRHTGTDGNSFVQEHRVWSHPETDGAERFLAARLRDAQKANTEAANAKAPALAKVERITREQYLQERSA